MTDDKKQALRNYQKSVELNPNIQNGVETLKKHQGHNQNADHDLKKLTPYLKIIRSFTNVHGKSIIILRHTAKSWPHSGPSSHAHGRCHGHQCWHSHDK